VHFVVAEALGGEPAQAQPQAQPQVAQMQQSSLVSSSAQTVSPSIQQ